MAEPLTVGLVGVGQRGLQHLKALWTLQQEGRVRVTGLCDAFPGNLEEDKLARYVPGFRLDGVATFSTFAELFAADRPGALYFSIPPALHDGEILQAARAGVHVFAEKPMSLYLDEAGEMERALNEAGVIAGVGFQRRFEAASEVLHEFMLDKRPVLATMVVDRGLEEHDVKHTRTEALGGPPDRVWGKSRAWTGGTIVEAGIHQTDLMRYWFGDIDWVQAAYVDRDPDDIEGGGDNPYAYSVTYGFASGGIGTLVMSRLRKVFRADGYHNILWTHGHVKIEDGQVVSYHYDGHYPPAERPSAEQIRHPLPMPAPRNSTEALARAFVDAVSARDPGRLRSTFSDGMNSLAAVLAANASHELDGRRIRLADFSTADEYAAFRAKPAR